jgi:hypothetical protein
MIAGEAHRFGITASVRSNRSLRGHAYARGYDNREHALIAVRVDTDHVATSSASSASSTSLNRVDAGLGLCAEMCLDARPAIDLDRPDDESDKPHCQDAEHGHDDAGSLSQGRAGWPEWATRYPAVDNPPNRDSYRGDRGNDHQAHWVKA